ncbi:carbonic anhydrase 1 [Drosophila elegans]|uniref:carbonic anhydrase 1 n=1 Tax=Drosophila elegans TaxID=30023 RepID=UPI0007E7C908|nr:carbonic anhydrase 1 [Drosophila elegans]XP_017126280.1 carbonic anhydrase 1 [Drosophila elegans]
MRIPKIDYICVKFMDFFGLLMDLAEDSSLIMMLVSCTMAVAFILNIRAGSTIFQNVAKAVENMRLKSMLDRQPSPINIANEVIKRQLKLPLSWTNYEDLPMAVVLENNGSTAILRTYTAPNMLPHLSGANLGGSYHFVEAIFKWGILRSEHSIGQERFSLEMQALHRCPQKKGTSEYLTISYLFVLTPFKNEPLTQIVDHLKWILRPGSSIELPPFDLGSLLRPFAGGHYTYHGTYDNGEVVLPTIWLIDSQITGVNSHQLAQFEVLRRKDGSRIWSNVREPQPLGSRTVLFHY